jgi:hypothetical protein
MEVIRSSKMSVDIQTTGAISQKMATSTNNPVITDSSWRQREK